MTDNLMKLGIDGDVELLSTKVLLGGGELPRRTQIEILRYVGKFVTGTKRFEGNYKKDKRSLGKPPGDRHK